MVPKMVTCVPSNALWAPKGPHGDPGYPGDIIWGNPEDLRGSEAPWSIPETSVVRQGHPGVLLGGPEYTRAPRVP